MNKKFVELLNEHTFWTDDTEKAEFLKDKKKLGDAFWVNYLGFAALYQANKDYGLLKQYFKADQVRLQTIKDDNQDLTFIIKALVDQKMMQTGVANELTRFLALLKQGQIPSIDEVLFREMLKKVKITKVPPNPILKKIVRDFLNGKITLQGTVPPMFAYSKRNKINTEFVHMGRKMLPQIDTDPDDKQPESDATKAKTKKDKDEVDSVKKTKQTTKQKAIKILTGADLDKEMEKTKSIAAFMNLKIGKIETIDDIMVVLLQVWKLGSKSAIKKRLQEHDWSKYGDFKTAFKQNLPSAAACLITKRNQQAIKTSHDGREMYHAWNNIPPLNESVDEYFNDATLKGIGECFGSDAKFANEFAKAFVFTTHFNPMNVEHLTLALKSTASRYNTSGTSWSQIRQDGNSIAIPGDRGRMVTQLGDYNTPWAKIMDSFLTNPTAFVNNLYKVEDKHGKWILAKAVNKWSRSSYNEWQHVVLEGLLADAKMTEKAKGELVVAAQKHNKSAASSLYQGRNDMHNSQAVKDALKKAGLLGKEGFTKGISAEDFGAEEFTNTEKFMEALRGFVTSSSATDILQNETLKPVCEHYKVSTAGQLLEKTGKFVAFMDYMNRFVKPTSVERLYGEASPLSKMPEIGEKIFDYYIANFDKIWPSNESNKQPYNPILEITVYNVDKTFQEYRHTKKLNNNSPKFKILNDKLIKPYLIKWISKAADHYQDQMSVIVHDWIIEEFGVDSIKAAIKLGFDNIEEWGNSRIIDYDDIQRRDIWSQYIDKNVFLSEAYQNWLWSKLVSTWARSFEWNRFRSGPGPKHHNHWGFTLDYYIEKINKFVDEEVEKTNLNADFTKCVMNTDIKEPKGLVDKFAEAREKLVGHDTPFGAARSLLFVGIAQEEDVTVENEKMMKDAKIAFTKHIHSILERVQDSGLMASGENMYDMALTNNDDEEVWADARKMFEIISNDQKRFSEILNNHEVFTPDESRQLKSIIVGIANNNERSRAGANKRLTSRNIKLDIEENPTDYDPASSLNYLKTNFMHKGKYSWENKTRAVIEQEIMSHMGDLMFTVFDDKKLRPELNKIIESYKSANKAGTVYKRLKDKAFVSPLIEGIMGSNTPIKPLIKMTPKELMQALRWNNFDFSESTGQNFRKKSKESYTDYLQRIIDSKDEIEFVAPPLHVTEKELSRDEQEEMSAEYIKHYSPGFAHGNTGLKFLKTFDVHLDFDEFKDFKTRKGDQGIIIPAFHGTGSVAASMILRFGFKVITQSGGGVQVTGKMLGNGVYFSNIIDKASQYIGDSGYSRRHGSKGYLFEIEAVPGDYGTDHKSAGLAGRDHIRSPEWCVFNPRAQLRIYKAHFVEMVPRTQVLDWAKKHGKVVKEGKHFKHLVNFSDFVINEENDSAYKGMNVIEYQFMDGAIPKDKNTLYEWDKWAEEFSGPNISVEPSTLGPVVVIKTPLDLWGRIMVDDTDYFCVKNPEGLRDQFFTLVQNAMKKK